MSYVFVPVWVVACMGLFVFSFGALLGRISK